MDEPGSYYNNARNTGVNPPRAVVVCKLLLSIE